MNDFRADLHCHSSFSDGTDTPTQLIELAIASGLCGLSITDHDTFSGYEEAFAVAKMKQFPLLNGIEFSASYAQEPVHILGYAYHMKSEAIVSLCALHKERREKRNLKILEKLKKLGIVIDSTELLHQGTWGRPHIAHALVTRGLVRSIQEAFEVYLAEGKIAYDPGEPISVEKTIETIHQAGGKAVLAHPHLLKRSTTIRAMLKMPFDGLECYYARFPLAQEKKWIDLARQRQWLITGGSDYHGSIKPRNALGASWVPRETYELLYSHFLENNNLTRLDPKHYLKYSQIQMGVAAKLIAQIDWQGNERLLDVGSGDGKITAFLRELVAEAVGVDLCHNMVNFASDLFPHIRFDKQSAEEMTFDRPFDVITCLSALHWVRQPIRAFEKMACALKPGGRAYILTYPVESIYWKPMYKTTKDPLFFPYLDSLASACPAQHYCEAAQQAGFEVISSTLQDHFATHDTLENLRSYLQAWLPNFIDLPEELRSPFLDLAVQNHEAQAVDQGDGKFHLPYTTLVLILQKPK